MISILIADEQSNNVRDIINYFALYDNIKISSIAYNGEDTYKEILRVKPNIVIINFNLPSCSIFSLMDKTLKFCKNTKFIIYSVYSDNDYKKLKSYSNILFCINSLNDLNTKLSSVSNIIDNYNSINLDRKITNELQYIGYKYNHKGTIFLSEIIKILIINHNIEDYCLSTDLYPIIAAKYHKTTNLVKVDIFKATEAMYYNCEMSKFYSYFNYDTKPNLKEIVYRVASNVLKNN